MQQCSTLLPSVVSINCSAPAVKLVKAEPALKASNQICTTLGGEKILEKICLVVATSDSDCSTRAIYKGTLCTLWDPHMSFLSVEPQSRMVLTSHSDSLLAQFDEHVQIIADRYLAFFQERSVNFDVVLDFTPTT